MVSKRSNGRRESRRGASEHTYRDKEREEQAEEEDHILVVCAPPFLAGGGRGDR